MLNIEIGLELIGKINSLGYDAYIVGGAVRDYLLGVDSTDLDVATSMPIDDIRKNFKTSNSKNPYMSIKVEYKGILFEVTEFRSDISYKDHRHPIVEKVNTIDEDLCRRDFTINALAMDKNKNIKDNYSGLTDLKNKKIRIIGNPDKRFEEDSLRILRAIYFSNKLGFEIDDETLISMDKNKNLLRDLSDQRLFEYFEKILYEPFGNGIVAINKFDLFSYIPEYKYWLSIADNALSKEENMILYYLKFGKMPPYIYQNIKADIIKIDELFNSNFDIYYLFINRNLIDKYRRLFLYLDKYDNLMLKLARLPISNEGELEVSKKEISTYFRGKEISLKIEEVIRAILTNKISNSREDILKYLGVD